MIVTRQKRYLNTRRRLDLTSIISTMYRNISQSNGVTFARLLLESAPFVRFIAQANIGSQTLLAARLPVTALSLLSLIACACVRHRRLVAVFWQLMFWKIHNAACLSTRSMQRWSFAIALLRLV